MDESTKIDQSSLACCTCKRRARLDCYVIPTARSKTQNGNRGKSSAGSHHILDGKCLFLRTCYTICVNSVPCACSVAIGNRRVKFRSPGAYESSKTSALFPR